MWSTAHLPLATPPCPVQQCYGIFRLLHKSSIYFLPQNILMIGPTGCGKTEIARRLAQLADAPFVKVGLNVPFGISGIYVFRQVKMPPHRCAQLQPCGTPLSPGTGTNTAAPNAQVSATKFSHANSIQLSNTPAHCRPL